MSPLLKMEKRLCLMGQRLNFKLVGREARRDWSSK